MAVPDVLRRPRHGRAGAGPPSKPSTPSRCWFSPASARPRTAPSIFCPPT